MGKKFTVILCKTTKKTINFEVLSVTAGGYTVSTKRVKNIYIRRSFFPERLVF